MTCTSAKSGFAALGPQWHDLLGRREWNTLFLTPEWQENWWGQFGDPGTELRLLSIGPEGDPLGIAPLVLRGGTLSFLGDTDLFDYHDFIEAAPEFHAALAKCLVDEPWLTMDLRSIPAFSRTVELLPEAFRAIGCTVTVEEEDVVPGLELPGSWDDYLAGLRGKDRHELRRKLRRLEGAGDVRVVDAQAERLDADFDVFGDLMSESREEKRDFMLPEREAFFRRIVTWAQQEDYLRLSFLEVNGERVAATLSFDYDGRRLLYNSGYRLSHAALSVGLMLKALSIKDAIERGLTYFDFLRGPEPYKYHLGGRDVGLLRIVVSR